MSDPEKPEVPAKPRRDPAALSSEYHKAHKQVMLWATILFIWELVGVDLNMAKDAGGNVGPIVTALKSPQAVPWVLMILVIYFLFKCSIEWGQCHLDRRKVRLAKADFFSAWVVAIAAIALYVGQAVSRVQFADLIGDPATRKSLFLGLLVSIVGPLLIVWRSRLPTKKQGWMGPPSAIILGTVFAVPVIMWVERNRGSALRVRFVLIGLLIGGALHLLVLLVRFLTPHWVNIRASLPKN